ncbi:MAG TPA: fucose isomerase, partial [Pelobium sp.]|nr:fucose isomerase [Pelobium sp.]
MNIYLVASGDLRISANQQCWQAQLEMENQLTQATESLGVQIIRAHAYDPVKKHGFIDSQKMGMEVFKNMV